MRNVRNLFKLKNPINLVYLIDEMYHGPDIGDVIILAATATDHLSRAMVKIAGRVKVLSSKNYILLLTFR